MTDIQKITPHLWFDKEAKEASEFYTSVFPDSKIVSSTVLHNTPSGDCDVVSFEVCKQSFMAISAGPLFKFNPSISFHVKCKTKEEVDALWEKLSKEGTVLMELGKYPFSERYGWLQDKYGVSWQIIYAGQGDISQKITPALMFVGEVCGKTEEAVKFYTSVFKNSKIEMIMRYSKGEEPDKEGAVKYAHFTLEGQEFGAMDSAHEHKFTFNEAISFIVNCDTQKEVDYYWEKLTADGGQESMCGWLKDKYGLSWQIIPQRLNELMSDKDKKKAGRATQAMLQMKKIIVKDLEKAAQQR